MPTFASKKLARRFQKTEKTEDQSASVADLNIKFGKLVRQVPYGTIKTLGTITTVFLICITLFSMKLFASAISISNHLGYFINMVSKGDGEILSSLQAIPVFLFIILDFALMFVVYRIFSEHEQQNMNWILFILLMASLGLICIVFILMFVIILHIYGGHEALHNGIVDAMRNYSSNSVFKKRIDRLQIEFQCCGSKKYDEWYNITWFDKSLVKKGASDNSQGNTPFSCCSIASIFPCIHHNIENSGRVYVYTPELNLSISTRGCYNRLREKKQEVGWGIVGNMFLYIVLQAALVICLRFLQTAHFETSKFEGTSRMYTLWLIGCYAGRKKVQESPPEPPPVPEELMD